MAVSSPGISAAGLFSVGYYVIPMVSFSTTIYCYKLLKVFIGLFQMFGTALTYLIVLQQLVSSENVKSCSV